MEIGHPFRRHSVIPLEEEISDSEPKRLKCSSKPCLPRLMLMAPEAAAAAAVSGALLEPSAPSPLPTILKSLYKTPA